jgi:hypothetical protein
MVINLFITSFILPYQIKKPHQPSCRGCGALISFVDPTPKPLRAWMGIFQLILELNLILRI